MNTGFEADTKPASVRLPIDLLEWLRSHSKLSRRTLSAEIVYGLERYQESCIAKQIADRDVYIETDKLPSAI